MPITIAIFGWGHTKFLFKVPREMTCVRKSCSEPDLLDLKKTIRIRKQFAGLFQRTSFRKFIGGIPVSALNSL